MAGHIYTNTSNQIKSIFYNTSSAGSIPNFISKAYIDGSVVFDAELVTLTISPAPSDAIVNFSIGANDFGKINGNSITIRKGVSVTYTVSKDEYVSQSDTLTVNSTQTIPVSLTGQLIFTIIPTPSDAVVTLTATGFTQSGNSIIVDPGTSVDYSISRTGYNTSSNTVIVNSTQNLSVSLTPINYTLTINPPVSPNDATITFNTTGTISGNSITVPYGTIVSYNISRTGYVTKNNQTYQVTQTETITASNLNKQNYTLTINPTPSDATVALTASGSTIYGNSVIVPYETSVSYSVSKTGYETQTGTTTVSATNTINVTLPIIVTITSDPSNADVRILSNGSVLASGTGSASTSVSSGTIISYDASLGGTTLSENSTITSPYSKTLTLNATSGSVTIVTSSSSTTLPYGKYKCIVVGAGAGGHTSYSAATAATRTGTGSSGGGGGGSGYAVIDYLTISNKSGQSATFTIGAGGSANNDGQSSSITSGSTTITANGGKTGYSDSVTQATYYVYGGTGGSGGGAGGLGGQNVSGSSSGRSNIDGGNGSYGGGNGTSTSVTSGAGLTTTAPGGTGYYNTTKSYENNYGAKVDTLDSGNPGKAGRGLISISSSLSNTSTFMNLTSVQTLYNSMGGGGGGGASGTPSPGSSVPANTYYGGAGGGGGGWQAGTNATSGNIAGTGGNGAILYMRVAWS